MIEINTGEVWWTKGKSVIRITDVTKGTNLRWVIEGKVIRFNGLFADGERWQAWDESGSFVGFDMPFKSPEDLDKKVNKNKHPEYWL